MSCRGIVGFRTCRVNGTVVLDIGLVPRLVLKHELPLLFHLAARVPWYTPFFAFWPLKNSVRKALDPFCQGCARSVPGGGSPLPPVSVSAHSKGLTRGPSVSAESKGLICPKMVQNPRRLGSAHSKGFSSESERPGNKKAAVACRLSMDLYAWEYNRFDSGCQGKVKAGGRGKRGGNFMTSGGLSRILCHQSISNYGRAESRDALDTFACYFVAWKIVFGPA